MYPEGEGYSASLRPRLSTSSMRSSNPVGGGGGAGQNRMFCPNEQKLLVLASQIVSHILYM